MNLDELTTPQVNQNQQYWPTIMPPQNSNINLNANTPTTNPVVEIPVNYSNPYQVQQQTAIPPQINVNVGWWSENISVEMKKQKCRYYGFFRIIILLVLVAIGFLMLLDANWIFKLSIDGIQTNQIYPIAILLSVIALFSYRKIFWKILWLLMFLIIIWGLTWISTYHSFLPSTTNTFNPKFKYTSSMSGKSLVHINTYIGNYFISGSNIGEFLEWNYKWDRALMESTWFTDQNTPYLYLKEDSNRNVIQKPQSNLELTFNNKYNFDFYAKNLIWNYFVDLSNLNFNNAELNWWVTNFDIIVWGSINSNSNLKIKSYWSNIEINVQKGIWVELNYNQKAGSIDLVNFEKSETEKWIYKSTNISSSQKIIKIDISVLYGNLKVNWID